MNALKVTPADIEDNISSEYYFTAGEGVVGTMQTRPSFCYERHLDRLTFCVLVLRNGFVVTGESACVSPENFNEATGRQYAREAAVEKIWPLLGYELRTKLANQS